MGGYVVAHTDILIDFLPGYRPRRKCSRNLLQEVPLAVTSVTLFELACGAQTPDQLHDSELLTQAVHVVVPDRPSALRAGAVNRELRAKGDGLVNRWLLAGKRVAAPYPEQQALQPGARTGAPRSRGHP